MKGDAEQAESLLLLDEAFAAAGDLAYEWDLAGDGLRWLGPVARILGEVDAPGAPVTGEAFNARIHPEDLPKRLQTLTNHLSGQGPYDCEYRVRGANGDFHWVHDRAAVRGRDETGAPVARSAALGRVVGASSDTGGLRLIGTLRLVTQRKRNEARLEYLANYDDLTGHFNKLRLREALERALDETQRFDSVGAFMVIGVDRLAMINSAYGYEAGDMTLIEIGKRLDGCLRTSDVIGRLGGDRFGAVLTRCDEHEALRAAERVVQDLRQQHIQTAAGPARITVSVGVVIFPQQSKTSLDAIAKAEGALRQAKTAGGNCAALYRMTEAQRRSYRLSQDIGAEVQEALKDDRLALAYQPVVGGEDRRIAFHECLLRLLRADGTVMPAQDFVPVVEQLGLIRVLDRRALEIAVADLERHPDITLAINISGLTVTERSWQRALVSLLRDRPSLAKRLIVEITETAALNDIEESARFVRLVRDLGCRVALDDFGAGYTTFRNLKALTVDIVKIDGSFIRSIRSVPQNQLFVRNLLGLARVLQVETVAECVESEEDAEFLVEEGINLLQGFHFGRPSLTPAWRQSLVKRTGAEIIALPKRGRQRG